MPSAVSQAACQPATASAHRATLSCMRGRVCAGLRAQDDLERRPEAGARSQRESTLDALRAGTDVLQALARGGGLAVEALAVIPHRHVTLVVPHCDDDLGTSRVRVLAHV